MVFVEVPTCARIIEHARPPMVGRGPAWAQSLGLVKYVELPPRATLKQGPTSSAVRAAHGQCAAPTELERGTKVGLGQIGNTPLVQEPVGGARALVVPVLGPLEGFAVCWVMERPYFLHPQEIVHHI